MNKKIIQLPFYYFLVLFLLLPCLFGAGFFVARYSTTLPTLGIQQIRVNTFTGKQYSLIDPLLGCEAGGKREVVEFQPLRDNLAKIIDAASRNGTIDDISVYFDTRDGRTLTINGGTLFAPASLMKVPTMIAVLRLAQDNPKLLDKKIYYAKNLHGNDEEHYKPTQVLEPGQTYTLGQLVARMIAFSDNEALRVILENVDVNKMLDVYEDLGIPIPSSTTEVKDTITVKQAANIFRFLYNATYLDRDYSELAMELLTRPDFAYGIRVGVPSTTMVAQKFGERSLVNGYTGDAINELHDCGVIYYPNRPYLLCVMTRGKDFNRLAQTIREISAATYAFMGTLYPVSGAKP